MPLFALANVRFLDILAYPPIQIRAGAVTFLCGRSGSGKSTLLKLLNATLSPSGGEISYLGRPLEGCDPIALRREVLLVGQAVFLFDGSIRENFRQFYAYRDLPAPADGAIIQALALCQAELPLEADCRTLSGGERQRVFLAVCLSLAPRALLLDEPTSALDATTADALMAGLCRHCHGAGISLVAITHDRALAQRHGDMFVDLDGEVAHG